MHIGEKRTTATILFSDIRNFSKIVNILSLEEIYVFLNDCFGTFVQEAHKYDGRIDKFFGDAATIVFGIPDTHDDDPARAIKCALDIQKRMEEISIKWRESLNFLVEIDIGISTGEVIAGNVGSEERMDYTIIGKNVKLASEINRLCKDYDEHILLDQFTYEKVKDYYTFKWVDEKLILGFVERIRLYTPIRM
jgi:adenylate cyclase